jgi:hypothetical protein
MATVADHVIPALQNSGGTPGVRAILAGRADELLDLVSINVSRRLLD